MRVLRIAGVGVGLPVTVLLVGELLHLPLDPAMHPQLLAPPPLDLFHDLRYAFLLSPSYLGFVLALVTLLGLRMLAFLLYWSVIAGLSEERLKNWLLFYGLALLLLFIPAGLTYAFAATQHSILFELYIVAVLVSLILLAPGPVLFDRSRQLKISLWQGYAHLMARPLTFLGLPMVMFVTLTGSGALIALVDDILGGPVRLAVMASLVSLASLTVLGLGWLYFLSVDDIAEEPGSVWGHAVTAGLVLVVVVFAVNFSRSPWPPPPLQWSDPPNDNIQVIMPGIDSATGLGAMVGYDMTFQGYPPERTVFYSYRGPGEGTTPLPYTFSDTHQSIQDSAQQLRRTLQRVKQAFPGQQVDIVALSLAGWIVRYYLLDLYDPSEVPIIEHVVIFSVPGVGALAPFPPSGQHGQGFIGAQAMRLLFAFGRAINYSHVRFDSPIWRQIVYQPRFVESLTFPLHNPNVPELVLWSVRDLPGLAGPRPLPGTRTVIVPTYHADVPWHPKSLETVRRFLADRPIPKDGIWHLIHRVSWYGAAPWKLPTATERAESVTIQRGGTAGQGR